MSQKSMEFCKSIQSMKKHYFLSHQKPTKLVYEICLIPIVLWGKLKKQVHDFCFVFEEPPKCLGLGLRRLLSGTFLSCISDMSAALELFWRIWSWCFVISADLTSLITWSRIKSSFAINRRLRWESRKPAIIWVCTIWSRRSPKEQRSALFWRSSIKVRTDSLSCWKRLTNCVLSKTKATFPLKWSLNFCLTFTYRISSPISLKLS